MMQEATVRACSDPHFYPHKPETVEHVQTHISHVFLAGPYVYKVKKAVRFPFLDFSTLEQRHHFCLEEARLNRRFSPAVYLDVLPITREPTGRLRLGGGGEVVEHVVWMRRLPASGMLVDLLRRDAAPAAMLETLACALAGFHAAAPTGPEVAAYADADALRASWDENMHTTAPFVGRVLAAEDHEILADFGPSFIQRHETLLRTRQQAGHIRDGHGDLHAEHVCFVSAPLPDTGGLPPLALGIYLFDCIEFSQALRCNDVASEIAFLAMDLDRLERPDLAAAFVAAYAAAANDPAVHILLPFYSCYRACVRGKVESLKSAEAEVDATDREAAAAHARQCFGLALRYAWRAGGPAVIACCGLSGTGKTTLAAALATASGFVLLSSDVIRKRHAGRDLDTPAVTPYGTGLYTAAAREATYQALCTAADAALARGQGVIVDATFIRRADRHRLATVARRQRRPYVFVECRADEAAIRTRLEARTTSGISDARWETHLAQCERREAFAPDEPRLMIETSQSVEAVRAATLRRLWQWRQRGALERGG